MPDTLRDQLQTTLGAAYTLERELGGGGMSRVFVARDAALERDVVVKVLAPELAAGVSAERFTREIKLAAGLQQANIVPLHSAGVTAEGLPYYTMPFVDGLSLRSRLERSGALPVAEAVGVLRDVARALAYAHERGVVHRDIKPENILLSGAAAVVTDFGIAKALSASRTQAPGGTLTQIGTSIGTPAYMAPEQAAGDPDTDHRADLYALGCVAYEMLRGSAPFDGRPTHQLFAAHMNETPKPIEQHRADVPRPLAALVARCLEKDPAHRPQSAREILEALDGVTTGGTHSATLPPRRRALIAAAMAAVLLLGAGAYALTRRHTAPVDAGPASVAVLPFENASGDTSSNYFADGMTDELATGLAKVQGLRVASRTSSYTFRKRDGLDARAIAQRLGVGAIVEGSVRRAGNQLRVTAQLTRGSDGQGLWADAFTVDANDAFAVQARLTQAIVTAIAPTLAGTPASTAALAKAIATGPRDPVAYDGYLRARYELNQRGAGVRRSITLFQAALAREPKFVDAWAGLASAWAVLSDYDATWDPSTTLDSTSAAARRLAELDSQNAEGRCALGIALALGGRSDEGIAVLRQCVALDPRSAVAHRWLGVNLWYQGMYEEGLRESAAAAAADPLSAMMLVGYANILARTPLRDSARALARRALALEPNHPGVLTNAAMTLVNTGDYREADQVAGRYGASNRVSRATRSQAAARAGLGMRDSVVMLLDRVERMPHTPQGLALIATVAAAAARWDRAFAAGDSATAKSGWLDWIEEFPSAWKPVVGDPRLQASCRLAKRDCGPLIQLINAAIPLPTGESRR